MAVNCMDMRYMNDLELFKKNVLKIVPAEVIYLFGSYAYGMPNEDSDLDIYVVVPDTIEDLSELYGKINLLWRRKPVSLDLLINHSGVFNRRKNGPTLERTIVQKGTILYGS